MPNADPIDPAGPAARPPIRTVGVMTSGGDCAGLNAVVRAVALHGRMNHGWTMIGIQDGSQGLMADPPATVMLEREWLGRRMLREGGTLLGTVNRGDPFHAEMPDGSVRDRSQDFLRGARRLGLDALIVVGGDGSMRLLWRLCRPTGIAMVGVPKTIDNDVPHTENTIGFSTALDVVTEALDRLQTTAASHQRIMVLEVMGRTAGHIAMHGGIAGGADAILVPELPVDLQAVASHLRAAVARQERRHALVVVAEGVRLPPQAPADARAPGLAAVPAPVGPALAARLEALTGLETRVTTLGHLQRGGTPNTTDRVLASDFGVQAVELVAAGQTGRMVAWQHGGVVSVPMDDVVGGPRLLAPDCSLVRTARALGICLG